MVSYSFQFLGLDNRFHESCHMPASALATLVTAPSNPTSARRLG
jgi:hypothetical protein